MATQISFVILPILFILSALRRPVQAMLDVQLALRGSGYFGPPAPCILLMMSWTSLA